MRNSTKRQQTENNGTVIFPPGTPSRYLCFKMLLKYTEISSEPSNWSNDKSLDKYA